MAKKTAPIEGTKMTKEFEFKLTRAELADKAEEMSALDGECIGLEREFDKVKKDFTAKIRDCEVKRHVISAVVRNKSEVRAVEVTMTKDFASKLVQFWFKGDVLEERAMTQQEMQLELDLRANKGKKKLTNREKDAVKSGKAARAEAPAEDISGVIRAETSRRSKRSSVDETPAVQ